MAFGTVKLNDGHQMPTIAFGTGSRLKGQEVSGYVEQALETGFSHIDTAAIYETEEGVRAGIKDSGLGRSDVFVTTKYDGVDYGGDVPSAMKQSLQKLGLEYVDLYLIHAPFFVKPDIDGAWRAFEALQKEGFAKSIGVSNFNLAELQSLVKSANVTPAVNQIMLHPYNYADNKALLAYCAKHNIVIEAYSSLAPITRYPNGPVDAAVEKAAKRLGASPTQIILSWVRSKGAVIVTTSTNKEHLKEYLAVGDLGSLTDDEIREIDNAGAQGPTMWRREIYQGVSGASYWAMFACMCIFLLVRLSGWHWKTF